MQTAVQWAFYPEPLDPKHQGLAHPLFSMLFGCFLNFLASYTACKLLSRFKKFQERLSPFARNYVLKFLVFYILFMVTSRYYSMGNVAFYDILWACNGSIINLILALYLDFPLLVMASLLDVAMDQTLWYLDLISFIFTGKFAIGVMKYLTWPQTSWAQVITGTHHLWFLPLCFFLIRESKRINFSGYFLSAFIILVFCAVARLLVPKEIIYEDGRSLYLNINVVWDAWKDVKKFYICSLYDSSGTGSLAYFLYVQFFWNSFNLIIFLGFSLIHNKIRFKTGSKEKGS